MNKQEIQDKLLNFIMQTFMVERNEINLDKSMIDEGIIDSFGLVEIASFMENTFSFVVEDDDMIRDNFGSVTKIITYIQKKIQS